MSTPLSDHHRLTAYSEIICLQQELGCRLWSSSQHCCAPHVLRVDRAAQTVIPNGCGPAGGLLFGVEWIACGDCSVHGGPLLQRRKVSSLDLPCHIILVREGHSASPDRSTSGVEMRPRIHVSCKHRDARPPSPHTPAAPAPNRSFLSHHFTASLGPPQTTTLGVGTASAQHRDTTPRRVTDFRAVHCSGTLALWQSALCTLAAEADRRCVLCAAVHRRWPASIGPSPRPIHAHVPRPAASTTRADDHYTGSLGSVQHYLVLAVGIRSTSEQPMLPPRPGARLSWFPSSTPLSCVGKRRQGSVPGPAPVPSRCRRARVACAGR